MMNNEPQYNAIVIGATGAVGRELVDVLLSSTNYNKITIFVRRTIERWEKLSPSKAHKLNIVKVDNLDFLGGTKEQLEKRLEGIKYDVVFNCLGSRVGRGDDEFYRVDYTYVVQSCELCEKLNIPHYSNCSAAKTDPNSCFMYMRVKGQAEEAISKKNVNYVSIMKPGLIQDRDNDSRCMEKCWGCLCCCMDQISTQNIARAMFVDDLEYQKGEKKDKKVRRITNREMLDMVKTSFTIENNVPVA